MMATVHFVEIKKVPVLQDPDPTELRLNPKHPLAWVILRFGKWLGLTPRDIWLETVKTRPMPNEGRVVERIMAQRSQLWRIFDRGAVEVLMGPEEEVELFEEVAIETHGQVGFNGEVKVCDLKIRVIPWMEGVLVL